MNNFSKRVRKDFKVGSAGAGGLTGWLSMSRDRLTHQKCLVAGIYLGHVLVDKSAVSLGMSKEPGGAVSPEKCWNDGARLMPWVHHTLRQSSVLEHKGSHFQLPLSVMRPD